MGSVPTELFVGTFPGDKHLNIINSVDIKKFMELGLKHKFMKKLGGAMYSFNDLSFRGKDAIKRHLAENEDVREELILKLKQKLMREPEKVAPETDTPKENAEEEVVTSETTDEEVVTAYTWMLCYLNLFRVPFFARKAPTWPSMTVEEVDGKGLGLAGIGHSGPSHVANG
ncbi:hypothetical protein ACLOJK_023777 [Asimina triloba]